MHRKIKKYTMDGIIKDDADFIRSRTQFEHLLTTEMREEGRVPVLDLGPFWTTSYNQEKDNYTFKLSLFGVYVGRRRAQEIEGVDGYGNWHERV